MARPRDPRRDEAFHLWKGSSGTKKLKDIADELGVSSSTVRKWKATDKWEEKFKGSAPKSNGSAPFRPGAPIGNKNAKGNKGERHRLETKMQKGIGVVPHQKGIKIPCVPANMKQSCGIF